MVKYDTTVNSANMSHIAGNATNAGAIMSVSSDEQIFSPIQITKWGDAAKPGTEQPVNGELAGSFGLGGGVGTGGHIGPTNWELNGYFPKLWGGDGTYWITEVDYSCVGNDGVRADNGDQDLNLKKTNRESINAVQTHAMRGPLLVSGYGFDVCDRPVPKLNAGAPGVFMFDTEAPRDRTTWKTGPVALKWDDERKVWEGGLHVVCGVARSEIKAPISPCHPTHFIMDVFRNRSEFDPNCSSCLTNCDLGENIRVINRDVSLSQPFVAGKVFVIAGRINYEWLPLWVGCPEEETEEDENSFIWMDCVCGHTPDG